MKLAWIHLILIAAIVRVAGMHVPRVPMRSGPSNKGILSDLLTDEL
jgi:hypothetical protein